MSDAPDANLSGLLAANGDPGCVKAVMQWFRLLMLLRAKSELMIAEFVTEFPDAGAGREVAGEVVHPFLAYRALRPWAQHGGWARRSSGFRKSAPPLRLTRFGTLAR